MKKATLRCMKMSQKDNKDNNDADDDDVIIYDTFNEY